MLLKLIESGLSNAPPIGQDLVEISNDFKTLGEIEDEVSMLLASTLYMQSYPYRVREERMVGLRDIASKLRDIRPMIIANDEDFI